MKKPNWKSRKTPELRAEVARIVALKKQIPRYEDLAAHYEIPIDVIRHMVSDALPARRTKVQLIHVKQRTKVQTTGAELDQLAAQLRKSECAT